MSFKTTKVQAQAVDIGDISELNGTAQILRDKPYDANLKFAIQSNDEAITKDGRMAITFLDDSELDNPSFDEKDVYLTLTFLQT